MQNGMSPSSARRDLPEGVHEYLQRESLTDEEWERIYDLRYCTILVPKKSDSNSSEGTSTLTAPATTSIEPQALSEKTESAEQQSQQDVPIQQQSLAQEQLTSSSAPPPRPSILTKHRSNSTVLPPTPTVPNSKRRRMIDPSLEFDNDEQPVSSISDEDSDYDAMNGREQGQSELGGVSEDEGPMSSNDPMFGFLRQPRRSSRRESSSSSTTPKKSASAARSFFSFWRSSSPDVEDSGTEIDLEPIEADFDRAAATKTEGTSTTIATAVETSIQNDSTIAATLTSNTTVIAVSTSGDSVYHDAPLAPTSLTDARGRIFSEQASSDTMEIDQHESEDADDNGVITELQLNAPTTTSSVAPETPLPQPRLNVAPDTTIGQDHRITDKCDTNLNNTEKNAGGMSTKMPNMVQGEASRSASSTSTTHWPIPSPTHHLLRERRPRANTDFSHLAWMSSPSLGASRSPTLPQHSLLKPRNFTPSIPPMHPVFGQREPFSLPQQPALLRHRAASVRSRRNSFSSDSSAPSSLRTRIFATTPAGPSSSNTNTLQSLRATSSSDDWTNYHWNHLEILYMRMNGDSMSEENLFPIVDKFLEEDARQSGQPNRWSRNMIRRRCVALHRIRHSDKRKGTVSTRPWEQHQHESSTSSAALTLAYTQGARRAGSEPPFNLAVAKQLPLTPFTPLAGPKPVSIPNPEALRELLHPKGSSSSLTLVHRRKARELARPYPRTAMVLQRTGSSTSGGNNGGSDSDVSISHPLPSSSTSALLKDSDMAREVSALPPTSMAALQRQERRKKMKLSQDIHAHKSVFKHRFAEGLKSVKQLLPFWREVESGQGTIKEEIRVPLVPRRKVKSVVDAFETAMDEEQASVDGSGSVAVGREGRRMSNVSMLSGSSLGMSMSRRSSVASGTTESVAEMLARGHAARVSSAVSSLSAGGGGGSSSSTLATPSSSLGSTTV